MNARTAQTLLLAAGVCFLVAGCLLGCGDAFHWPSWLGGAETQGTAPGGTPAEPYNIAALFWTWARILIGLGIVGAIASIFVPLIPTRACASVAGAGIGCAIIAKFFAAYGWLVYAAFGVGAVVCLWPFVEAFRRWAVARATGQPIKGNTGLAAIKKLNPLHKPKRSPFDGLDPSSNLRGGVAGGVVSVASPGPESDRTR